MSAKPDFTIGNARSQSLGFFSGMKFLARKEFREICHREFGYLKVSWPWLLTFAFVQYLHSIMHNLVYYLEGVYGVYGGPLNALNDLGFMLIPNIETSSLVFLPTNGILYGMFAIAFFVFCSSFFLSMQFSPIQALWRALFASSICVTLRVVTFMVTLVPAPNIHCEQTRTSSNHSGETFKPPSSVSDFFGSVSTDSGCGDLIFSSHVMYGLIITCTLLHYYPTFLLRITLPIFVLALAMLCIAQRSHYTVDVVVAGYTVPLVWLSLCYLLPKDISRFRFWLD